MDTGGLYRIKVQGVFPESWVDRLGGLQVVSDAQERVTLEGWLQDQAALAGVLEILYELRLPILEVTRMQ